MGGKGVDPERARQLEGNRLAKTELERQLALTTNESRKKHIAQAIAELNRRIAALAS